MKVIDVNFELKKEDIELSKRLFNDKILRIIVPNGVNNVFYNSVDDRHSVFPENKLSFERTLTYVEHLSNSSCYKETISIVTNSMQIITSVPKCLCRYLVKDCDNIIFKEFKKETFYQNSIDLLCDLSGEKRCPSTAYSFFSSLIKRIESGNWETNKEEELLIRKDIELCGDEILSFNLYKKLNKNKQ